VVCVVSVLCLCLCVWCVCVCGVFVCLGGVWCVCLCGVWFVCVCVCDWRELNYCSFMNQSLVSRRYFGIFVIYDFN